MIGVILPRVGPLTVRELPPDEWSTRLEGTDLEAAVAVLVPGESVVIVVEDAAGRVVGHWALLRYWHAEGVWVHPEARGGSAVQRRLLAGMRAAAEAHGARVLLTGSLDPAVRHLLEFHLQATQIPGETWAWPVKKRPD